MNGTPKGNRLHIGIFGRVNTGKSSFLNLVTGQDVSITSSVAGTTTDVVEKAVELLPLGPVLFLDTAGLGDHTELGRSRMDRTDKALERADIAVLVLEADIWTEDEEHLLRKCQERKTPVIAIINKVDVARPSEAFIESLRQRTRHQLLVSSLDRAEREEALHHFKRALIDVCPDDFLKPPALVSDLVPAGGLAVLVVPIDLQAPKGRLILPQVQTIREALDSDATVMVVKERELTHALGMLNRQPDIVICDSQAVLKVTADTPPGVKCTTFSILFARAKGDLEEAARGAARLQTLKKGDKVLVAEGCSHHALEDDIGRVKIPRWLRQYTGTDVAIDVVSGRDFPSNLNEYRSVIHCGACTLNRKEMLHRVEEARRAGTAITNYGVAISFLQGAVRRVLTPFPTALQAFERELREQNQGLSEA